MSDAGEGLSLLWHLLFTESTFLLLVLPLLFSLFFPVFIRLYEKINKISNF